MPLPRAPIITDAIVTGYPSLLSLISKTSGKYHVSLPFRFVSIFCCMGNAMSGIEIAFRILFRVTSQVLLLSQFFVV